MTDRAPWVFTMNLSPGPTIEECWLKLEAGRTDSPEEARRTIWIPAVAILPIEQGFTKARYLIASHLKGVQQLLDEAQIELASLPETNEREYK